MGTNRSPTEIDQQVGNRIRLARKQAKLSQTELAQPLGVTYQQVQKYENGTDRVAVSRLVQIARILKVSAASLIPPDDESPDLVTSDEMEVLVAFRKIEKAPIRRAAIDTIKNLAYA